MRVDLWKAPEVSDRHLDDTPPRLGNDILTALADPARNSRPTTDGDVVGKCSACSGPIVQAPDGTTDAFCRSCGVRVPVAKAAPSTRAEQIIEAAVDTIVHKSGKRMSRQEALSAFMRTESGAELYRRHAEAATVKVS